MKKKLILKDLQIQSFITTVSSENAVKALGGANSVACLPTNNKGICHTLLQSCISGCVSCPECVPV